MDLQKAHKNTMMELFNLIKNRKVLLAMWT